MTIPFPTVRIVRADAVAAAVVAFVLVALGVFVALQSIELRDVQAERDQLRRDRNLMESKCAFVVDGSAVCPAGTFTVGAK